MRKNQVFLLHLFVLVSHFLDPISDLLCICTIFVWHLEHQVEFLERTHFRFYVFVCILDLLGPAHHLFEEGFLLGL